MCVVKLAKVIQRHRKLMCDWCSSSQEFTRSYVQSCHRCCCFFFCCFFCVFCL